MVSIYTAMYTFYSGFTKIINHFLYTYVLKTLLFTCACVKGKKHVYTVH